jgi:hypothetical protein
MDMQQIMEMLTEMRADIRTSQATADAHQAKMDAAHKEMMAEMRAWKKKDDDLSWKDRSQGFEGNPEEMESESDHQEVP